MNRRRAKRAIVVMQMRRLRRLKRMPSPRITRSITRSMRSSMLNFQQIPRDRSAAAEIILCHFKVRHDMRRN